MRRRTSSAASKRRWEHQFRDSGARMVGVRLSPAAATRLAELREHYACSDRDVIEGLLFGTVTVAAQSSVATVMREHGFSREEAEIIVNNGWNKP